jgi:hypothetical protein
VKAQTGSKQHHDQINIASPTTSSLQLAMDKGSCLLRRTAADAVAAAVVITIAVVVAVDVVAAEAALLMLQLLMLLMLMQATLLLQLLQQLFGSRPGGQQNGALNGDARQFA